MAREFELIARHFAPLTGVAGLGLRDDAAVFAPPAGRDLVVTSDAIVETVHFRAEDPPDLVARKLLRVNLSDLAAMGAEPLGYTLTVSVPKSTPEAWFEAFARGLAQDQAEFGVALMGGDTTSTPGPISLTATLFGHVAPGAALRRGGARVGDLLCVTGTIGDGALGLLALRGEVPDADGYLAGRYLLPRPRLGLRLGGLATAGMDISDGLLQDAGHMAAAAGLAVEIRAPDVPLSAAAAALGPAYGPIRLGGGDDYELLLAVAPADAPALAACCAAAGVTLTIIGQFLPGPAHVRLLDGHGEMVPVLAAGFSHF